jgi:prepilin-type N-terminal cleavage/methylation domain-containing protein
MSETNKHNQKGFTIIEVLIVLAVGGLIMLIVFQAIPNLQRSARNNQRKQDIASILEAVSHYELSNSGSMPDPCGGGGGQAECIAPTGPLAKVKLGHYQEPLAGTNMTITMEFFADSDHIGAASNPNSINKVAIYNYQHCDPDHPGDPTHTAAGFRDVVALYSTENGSHGPTKLCQEL